MLSLLKAVHMEPIVMNVYKWISPSDGYISFRAFAPFLLLHTSIPATGDKKGKQFKTTKKSSQCIIPASCNTWLQPTCPAAAAEQSECWRRLCRWTGRWRCRWGRCLRTPSITSPPDAPVFLHGYFGFCRFPAGSPCGREADDPPPPKITQHIFLYCLKDDKCYNVTLWLGWWCWL